MDSLLPTDIQAVIEQTQKIEDELFGKPVTLPPADAPPKPEDVPPKVDEPPITPPADLPPAVDTPPVTDGAPPIEAPPAEDFEHKFKVLQGKYNKEIKEGKDKVRETSDRLLFLEDERSKLLGQLVDLTGKVTKGKDGEPVDTPSSVDLESLPETQYIKTEFPDVWKAMKVVMAHSAKDTQKKFDDVEKKIETSTKASDTTSWNTFNQYLDTNVEGWRDVNVDPEFKEWLKVPEKYSGITKLELINRDISSRDGISVAKYFKDFATEKAVIVETPPKGGPTPPPVAPPQGGLPKSKPGSPPPKRPATPENLTTEHITDFYEKLQRGHFIGREAEAAAEEKRIEKAVSEKRVE